MSQHHIKEALPGGELVTYCGKTGYRDIGGGITISGKWSMSTTSKKPTMDSCEACVKALPAASKPPTIYTALRDKLGREPSNRELIDRCVREYDAIETRGFSRAMNRAAQEQHAIRTTGKGRAKK